METGSDLFKIIRALDDIIFNDVMLYACDFFFLCMQLFLLIYGQWIVRGVISSVMENEKLLQSTPAHDMKQKFLSSTMDRDDDLELFDEFCVNYVAAMDAIFINISKRIRSPATKRTRAWEAFHQERSTTLKK